ncbi:DUF4352 domain-containing protein [Marinococcus halophilus]|uniref:DUF4352 domain-containing protein n=1 Tax=Marinococcus halophilus TaxID=1371 RepID=A0A510Y4R5_MARHA|nr:DUF4352 domain-containing protein [Marinococcus halophilus]GEK58328.1 hypothetical protein MHA01_12330 [Marinococcus halophilus]
MGKMFKGCLTGIGALVLVVIIIMIIVMATGGDGEESSGDSSNNEGSSEESNASEDGDSEEETYGTGEEVQVGEVTYVINGMETASSAGIEGLEEEASGIYIVLDVEVTNNGNEAITMGSSYIKLLNGDNTYEADDFNSELFVEEINPDSTATGDVVFDVNEDVAEAEGLQAQVQEGAFGSNSAKVNLNE